MGKGCTQKLSRDVREMVKVYLTPENQDNVYSSCAGEGTRVPSRLASSLYPSSIPARQAVSGED